MKGLNRIKGLWKLAVISLAAAVAYKLNIILIFTVLVSSLIVIYLLIKEQIKKNENKSRFEDIVSYMEQVCYSFKKTPKIRLALIDAQKVGSVQMKEILEEVIVNIDSGLKDNIYEESLKILEEEYDCKRLRSLHKFIVKIERQGGEFESHLDLLLDDIKDWSDRTEIFRRNVEQIKRNVLISIGATCITCGFMAYLIPAEFSYTSHPLYQMSSGIMIIIMQVIYYLVYKKLNFDWLKEESNISEVMIDKYYDLLERGNANEKNLSFVERMSYKKVKKRLKNEITKAFPDWIRDTAINLQQQTVQSAIESSYSEVAYVLKRPIRKLLIDFEDYPVGIEPYDRFLNQLDVPDIHSSIKMFYCINELGKEETRKQTNAIIDRNNKLLRQAEEMKNKDRTGVAGMLTAVPMIAGVIKIVIDMVLMIIVFTSAIGSVMNGG